MKRVFWFVIVVLSLWGGVGCVKATHIPAWAGKNWQEGDFYYFSGISDPSPNEQVSRQKAYIQALAAAGEYVGVTLTASEKSLLSNQGQELFSRVQLQTGKVVLAEGEVTDFICIRQDEMYVGYLTVAFRASVLHHAKEMLYQQRQAEQEQRRKNASSGPWHVDTPRQWPQLAQAVEKELIKQGFVLQKRGKVLKIAVKQFSCHSLSKYQLRRCTLVVSLQLPFGERTVSAAGYGTTQAQVKKDMLREWQREIEQLFLEDK